MPFLLFLMIIPCPTNRPLFMAGPAIIHGAAPQWLPQADVLAASCATEDILLTTSHDLHRLSKSVASRGLSRQEGVVAKLGPRLAAEAR